MQKTERKLERLLKQRTTQSLLPLMELSQQHQHQEPSQRDLCLSIKEIRNLQSIGRVLRKGNNKVKAKLFDIADDY